MTANKLDLVLHPVRLQLLRILSNRQLSISELQQELSDIPIATLYRHTTKLLKGGIIVICDQRLVKGTVERIFSLPNSSAAIDVEELKKTSKEDHFRYFSTFIATLLDDYRNYLDAGTVNLVKDGVGYRTAQLYLTDAELTAMSKDIHKAMLPYLALQPKRGRVARILSTILIPKDKSRRK